MSIHRSLWSLEPDLTYLNHGSFGACPQPVQLVQQNVRAEMESQPMRFFGPQLESRLDAARAELAAFVGADAEDLVFVPNATTAVNAVLRSLPLEPGDELLTTDHAYPACKNALDFVAARTGVRVVVAELPFPTSDPAAIVTAIAAAVSPATRLALIDHVTSPTALIMPVAAIAETLAARGVEVLVDGAHGPGMVPLDLRSLVASGIGYYAGNLHKWVCAPKGAGFLFVRRERQDRVRPVVISHGAGLSRRDRSRFLCEFDWVGTADPSAYLAVPAALGVLGSLWPGGWDELRTRNRDLVRHSRRVIAEAMGAELPAPDEMIGAIASIPLPDAPGQAPPWPPIDPLQNVLLDHYRIQTMLLCWPRWPRRWVRISAQAYNAPEEYVALAAALTQELGLRS